MVQWNKYSAMQSIHTSGFDPCSMGQLSVNSHLEWSTGSWVILQVGPSSAPLFALTWQSQWHIQLPGPTGQHALPARWCHGSGEQEYRPPHVNLSLPIILQSHLEHFSVAVWEQETSQVWPRKCVIKCAPASTPPLYHTGRGSPAELTNWMRLQLSCFSSMFGLFHLQYH